ncbi:S41 family peptidase [Acidicapsa dinghuensis]|uniref:S41 family peptidase n=1 Tax=Acidicapsa dinghuensis TaxID=2218256 RepID=A0ABW1EDW2_9BACT|nr:S41 family peptidase [Acidicapsa dinghuensis]
MSEEELNRSQRTKILERIEKVVADCFYDPTLRGVDWRAAVAAHREAVLSALTGEQFERELTALLSELKASHVGVFRKHPPRGTAKLAISASYAPFPLNGEDRWTFQDVHKGGPASVSGLLPGDVLLSIDDREFKPPEHPIFETGKTLAIKIVTRGMRRETRHLVVPLPARKRFQLPQAAAALVVHKRLDESLGYIRISSFPGIAGVDVANAVSAAVDELSQTERLIIDVRGNTGGGAGVLRVMSLLTPERLPVGYSVNRKQLKLVGQLDRFSVFDRIPPTTKELRLRALMFLPHIKPLLFGSLLKPILLRTEGLGVQPFHKRVVLLTDRHTASAAEILVAFAREHDLAVVVGEATPGRVLQGSAFGVGYGYRVALPIAAYHTARDWILEGHPIQPDIEVPFDPDLAREGLDPQMDQAVATARQL